MSNEPQRAAEPLLAPLFFTSYARADAREDLDGNLRRFARELDTAVRAKLAKKGIVAPETGFFDKESLQLGADWDAGLLQALQTARVFIPLYSARYFQGGFCGREWQLFDMRQQLYLQNRPPWDEEPVDRILPVLWADPEDTGRLPPVASRIHYDHSRFDADYARYGLARLMMLTRYQAAYLRFLDAFSDEVTRRLERPPLPALAAPPSLGTIPNAFTQQAGEQLSHKGPRSIQFLYVAARSGEMQDRQHCYGQEGGRDWRPYLPPAEDEVGWLAQEIVTRARLHYEVLPLDEALIGRLQEAEDGRKIVIILIDPWTLRLPSYKGLMQQFDRSNFGNTGVLFLWNELDQATVKERQALLQALREAFKRKSYMKDPDLFLDVTGSKAEFEKLLADTLAKARARILELFSPTRPLPPGGGGPSIISPVPG